MSERLAEFGDAEVAVVTFTAPERLASYINHLGVTFPVVTDVDRELYRALGIERGTRRQVWSLGTLKMYRHLVRSGRKLPRTDEDIQQLGADVVIAPDGTISKLFRPATPDARPSGDDLLDARQPI